MSKLERNLPNDEYQAAVGANSPSAVNVFATISDLPVGGLTSVGLSMPSAFNLANNPLTSNGTIAVSGAGTALQYIDGTGALQTFPTSTGGGTAVSYYLNGSVNQGTFSGNTYYEMSSAAIIGTNTDFNIAADGYIAQFITDPLDPNETAIPQGAWTFQTYFSASSGGGTPQFYVELYKYDDIGGTFTLIGTSLPEVITGGTSIDLYTTSISVPLTSITTTDRLAVRYYVQHDGRTITLHTQAQHLDKITTTFAFGLTRLNGLTNSIQFFQTGTTGADFGITQSGTDTHVFNLPVASAINTGKLSNTDWSTFNSKQAALLGTGIVQSTAGVISYINGASSDFVKGDGSLDSNVYITAAALSGYVPYTGATTDVDLNTRNLSNVTTLTASTLNISSKGSITSSGSNTILFNNTTADGTTKLQFNGVDSLILKGATTSNTASLTYTKPTRTGLIGENVEAIVINTGTSEWTDWANFPGVIQKEIEITSPYYTATAPLPPPPGPSGEFYTLYVNSPTVDNWGVYGYALGIYGSFQMKGNATDYSGGTILDIGNDGDGTIIGYNTAKLSFFGNIPIVKPAAVTTVQNLYTALSNLGLIASGTLADGIGTVTSVGLTTGTTGTDVNVSGSPVTGSGSITLNIPDASATARGLVTTGTQTIAGDKTFKVGTSTDGIKLVGLVGSTATPALYFAQSTPSAINYTLNSTSSLTRLNATSIVDIRISDTNKIRVQPYNIDFNVDSPTTGAFTAFKFTGAAATTGQTASTNIQGFLFTPGARQWATGAITTQQEFLMNSPTYSFAGASTITNAYSLYVNSPIASTNATITNNYAAGFGGNIIANLPLGGYVKIYDNTGPINYIESDKSTVILTTGSNYLTLKPSGIFTVQTNGVNTNRIVIDFSNATGNTTNQFTHNLIAQSSVSANTEVSSVLWNGATKTWQDGNITNQRWFYIKSNTAAFSSVLSTITNSYGLYVEKATVGTNAAITNNYALGLDGSLALLDASNIVLGTGTGTKIGTATTQKLGFYNATPIVQPAAVTTVQGIANALTSLGLLASSTISFWNVTTQAGASYSASNNDYVLINAATHIVTLPAASANARVGVKMINATVTSIQVKTASAGVTIDGTDRSSTGLGIYNQYDAYTFVSDGTNWFIMG